MAGKLSTLLSTWCNFNRAKSRVHLNGGMEKKGGDDGSQSVQKNSFWQEKDIYNLMDVPKVCPWNLKGIS
jgi:hypothetical protein